VTLALCLSAQPLPGQETLDDAWKLALAADHRLKSSNRSTQAARETLAATRAARMPIVATENGYTVLNHAMVMKLNLAGLQSVIPIPLPTSLPFSEDHFFASTTMLTLPVFTSGRIQHAIGAATAGLEASVADGDRAALDLKMSVAESFTAVLRCLRLVEVATQSVVTLEGHEKDAANMYEFGLVAKNDMLAAQVVLAEARQRKLQATNGLDLATSAYNRLLGREFGYRVTLVDPTRPDVEDSEESLDARARTLRPELRGLEHQAEALRHQASVERAASLPQAAFLGGYTYLQNQYLANPGIWSATVGLKWNVFDSGMARRKARALAERAAAVTEIRADAETLISLQVRQALLDGTETRQRIEVARVAMAQAEENLTVAKDRYSAGVGTNTEVLDAEALRTRSAGNLANATYDLALAGLRLRRAVGTI